jgi:ribosomal protein S18 acetylase RimI-like enzyme
MPAGFPENAPEVASLFREYAASLSFDLGFQSFDAELAGLPGAYAPPDGQLLLARRNGDAVGCVALRRRDRETGEVKRLYVRAGARGSGAGRKLVEQLIEEARRLGYRALCLDTTPEMAAAQELYRRLGFGDIEPYTYNPVAGARFLGRAL